MDSNNDPGPSGDVIDLTSLSSPELPSQKTEVACPAQQIISLEHSQRDTTNIATSSDKTLLFSPPAVTLDIFKEYSDEDDDKTCKKEPEVTLLSSRQKPDSRTLLPGFTTPEQTFRNSATSNYTDPFARADNYDDDDAVGVFAPRIKRPKPLRTSLNSFITQRLPSWTQQGQRLPQHLRSGYRRGKQDIIVGGEPYQDLDYIHGASRRHISTNSYGHVHTTLPAANIIPTDGRGYIVTNSFMTGAQRKRLEQQERLEKALAELQDCVSANPTDVKLQGKLLHLTALQNRLEQNENAFLKSVEVGVVKEVERMLSRRRMHMVTAEFENQAKAMVENMVKSSSVGRRGGRKRGFDEGSISPLSSTSHWSEAGGTSERSSFSHPSTAGKTVPQSYYQRPKRG
ncbi:hypothetical protein F66182_16059, partial [Fusarium sp. NRRL 66182]